jgi:hypothetical protein
MQKSPTSEQFRLMKIVQGISLVNTAIMNVLTPMKQIRTLSGRRKQYRIKKPTTQMKLKRQLMNS